MLFKWQTQQEPRTNKLSCDMASSEGDHERHGVFRTTWTDGDAAFAVCECCVRFNCDKDKIQGVQGHLIYYD